MPSPWQAIVEQAEEALSRRYYRLQYNHGTIQIVTPSRRAKDPHFSGIPNFAPFVPSKPVWKRSVEAKQLLKGRCAAIRRRRCTGVRPIDKPTIWIVGAGRVLQFDVVVSRPEIHHTTSKRFRKPLTFQPLAGWLAMMRRSLTNLSVNVH